MLAARDHRPENGEEGESRDSQPVGPFALQPSLVDQRLTHIEENRLHLHLARSVEALRYRPYIPFPATGARCQAGGPNIETLISSSGPAAALLTAGCQQHRFRKETAVLAAEPSP